MHFAERETSLGHSERFHSSPEGSANVIIRCKSFVE